MGATVEKLSPEHPSNTFSIYTPTDTTVTAQVFTFNSAVAPEVLVELELSLS
jgi:hypothetical protein